jgi:hypothetical protein
MSRTAYDMAQKVIQSQNTELSRPLDPQPPAPPRRSIVGEVLHFFGWTFLIALLIGGAVVLTSIWLVSDAARDLFSQDTNVKIVTGQAVVESIKQVNKQVFIEHYNTVDIDYTEAPEGWLSQLPISQSFVVLLKGRIPAGFDLSQLRAEDVWVSSDGRRVQLVLPPPTIFVDNVNIDFEGSRVLTTNDTCPQFLCQDQLAAFQEQIAPQGRQVLVNAALQSGIMEQAADSGQRYYEQFLESLGFEEVRVVIREATDDCPFAGGCD